MSIDRRPNVYGISRDLWDHPLFPNEPFSEREAWVWLIGAATWKRTDTRGNAGRVTLERGEFSFSVRFLGQKFGWDVACVHRFLLKLKKNNMIEERDRNGNRLYFVCNYNRFQVVGSPERNGSATGAQQERNKEETGKQGNKEKEVIGAVAPALPRMEKPRKVNTALPEAFPSAEAKLAAVEFWNKRGRADLAGAVEDEAEKFRDHHASRGNRMADWKAAWRVWVKNALAYTRPPQGQRFGVVAGGAMEIQYGTIGDWVSRLEIFAGIGESKRPGSWVPKWGPRPDQPGCLVPQEARDKFDEIHGRQMTLLK